MSVVITPFEQLEFSRPFTRVNKKIIHIKNPGDIPILFKIKTTAPKQYSVRPNVGRIEPRSEIKVQVVLLPFKEEPKNDFKIKDKFLVQTTPINSDMSSMDFINLWRHIETEAKELLYQHKIKCVFVPLQDNTIISTSIPPPKLSAEEKTPLPHQFTTGKVNENHGQHVQFEESELNMARNTIKHLREEIKCFPTHNNQNSTFTTQISDVSSYKIIKNSNETGYKPQIVIGVAVLVFILTYLLV